MASRRTQSVPAENQSPTTVEVIDPRWLLKAGALVVLFAFVCGYLALCLLFWQGDWQFVLHPSRSLSKTPASVNLSFEAVRFGVSEEGRPALAGWWIPSDADGKTARTALVLHGADGSMEDSLPQASLLHDAHLNVLLFDYRGYGASAGKHPTQNKMEADTHTAWDFLHATRQVAPSSLVVFGEGVGGALALEFCATSHIECRALILDAPEGDLTARVKQDPRTRAVPVSILFRNAFPLAGPLRSSTAPKLIVSYGASSAAKAVRDAASPKTTVELPRHNDTVLDQYIKRFLDEYPASK